MNYLWLINQFAHTADQPGHTRQFEVASGLVKSGWKVDVFASDFHTFKREYSRLRFPALWRVEKPAGICWTWLWVSPYRKNNWKRHLNMLSFCIHLVLRLAPAALIGRITGNAPDVILASSPQLPAAFTCLSIARLTGIPVVIEVRDLWPQVLIDLGGMSRNRPLVRVLSWMERQVYRHADTVVVLAKGSESFVRDRGAHKTAWLPNGPDLDVFAPRPLPPERSVFTVLYAGAHGEANGLENVIAAARLLEQQQVPVRLRFVGDGPEKKALMELAEDLQSVSFEEPIPKSDMPDLMADADAILLSLKDVSLFRYGVSPNKLYDAYALGRPVITTVDGVINSEVEENLLGVTAPPGDPSALASAIVRLMSTSRLDREKMAQRAIALSRTIYSRQRVIEKFRELLEEIVSPPIH